MSTTTTNTEVRTRLLFLVERVYQEQYRVANGSVPRDKAKTRRKAERQAAEEVVGFAWNFVYGGVDGEYMTPSALYLSLLDELIDTGKVDSDKGYWSTKSFTQD